MKFRLSVLAVAILVLSIGACKRAKNENLITIGEYGSMTGSEATFGTSTHRGLEMIVNDINSAGGIKGKKLKLISVDDAGKPEEAVTAVTKLITQDNVDVVIGEVASSRSMAAAPVAQRYKVPLISPASTNPKVTEAGDYIFRVCFIDPFQGKVISKFSRENLKAKSAALLIDRKSDYSIGLSDFFRKDFVANGGQIVDEENYASGDIDFKGQLTSMKSKNPDIVVFPGYYTEVGLALKQARSLGMKMPFIGGDGWDSPKLIEIGGDSLNGSYFSNHYTEEDKDPKVQDFISRYKKIYGEVPDAMSVLAYDTGLVLADSLKRATDSSHSALRDAIAATKNFPGVTGKITIDKDRNASKPAVVIKIDNGKLKFAARVEP